MKRNSSSWFPLTASGWIFLLLLQGCKDPVANEAGRLEGTWHSTYFAEVTYETDRCYGTIAPMATETWDVTLEIIALNTQELEATLSWYPSNFIITDFSCGSLHGIVPENMPIERIYGYVQGNNLILSDQDNSFGIKLYSGNFAIQSSTLSGGFSIQTQTGSSITQVTSASNLTLRKY